MTSTQAYGIFTAGATINMAELIGFDLKNLPTRALPQRVEIQEVRIEACWRSNKVQSAESGVDANVFGGLGVLLVSDEVDELNIPEMNALDLPQEFLKKYGAELIPLDIPFTLDKARHQSLEKLFFVQYDWDADYIDQYIMKPNGGGGVFVETHPFPQLFTPLEKNCSGALILGVDNHDGSFSFVALKIPFGYTMKIASNVIHGDSFFVGNYAIALTITDLANSVIIKRDTPDLSIQKITPLCPAAIKAKMPLLFAEHGLASAFNRQMRGHTQEESLIHCPRIV